jgi:hypothetical protein
VNQEEIGNQPAVTPSVARVETLGPEDLVRAFIADYESWNKLAYQISSQNPGASLAAAEAGYVALLRKFCPPDRPHQPIAFGSNSSHDSVRETILSAEFAVDSCVVKTRHTKTVGSVTIAWG